MPINKESLLKPGTIRHPSWRIYKIIKDLNLKLLDYGLKDTPVEILYINDDDLMSELKKVLTDDTYKDTNFPIKECLDIFREAYDRQLMEGMLLAGKSVSEVCETLDCDDALVLTYKSLFFDTSIFRNSVDKLIYVKRGTIGEDSLSKTEILSKGTEYLKAKYGIASNKLSVADILSDTLAKAYLKMIENADQEGSDAQESAIGWSNTIIKVAEYLRKNNQGDLTLNDLVIELRTGTAPTKSIADLE